MKEYKKYIAIFATVLLLFMQNMTVVSVLAAPDLPDAPDNSQEEQPEDSQEAQQDASEPDTPDTPDTTDNNPDESEETEEEPQSVEESTITEETQEQEDEKTPETAKDLQTPEAPEVDTSSGTGNSGEVESDGQVGGATIDTGNATGTGSVSNLGNTNVASNEPSFSDSGDVTIANTGNGSNSDNDATISLEDNALLVQDNDANIQNDLEVDVNTGNNSASKNVGGNNTIDTGNATAVGTIVNSVNTNVAGAMVSEFNVTDDHVGDIVLDYEANCVSGCGGSDISLLNKDNGSESENLIDADLASNSVTFQSNEADVVNDLVLVANTGNNTADNNTGGNNSIDTGNATVNGNVINMLNNNIAGNVVYGVVNIFGELIGDIIVPEKYAKAYDAGDISIGNVSNGSGSENTGELYLVDNQDYTQVNDADIINNLVIDANTGGNTTSSNTSGNNSIDTGNVDVNASILNIANNNIVGGDWWIVLVNEAGNWIGKIFAPEGALNGGNFAAKGGTSSQDSETGAITLSNEGNGADSDNTASLNQENNSELIQTNNAKIVNNIDLTANTGNNSTSRNTGGSNEIDTGNANVQFNLINFLNNNFAGGNVFLTVVNVFGGWTGDFLTPGQDSPDESSDTQNDEKSIGGSSIASTDSNSSSSTSDTSSSNSGESSASNESVSQTPVPQVLASTTSTNKTNAGSLLASAVEDDSFDLVETANAATTQPNSTKTRINLAWAVLLLPAYIVVRIVRRRFLS